MNSLQTIAVYCGARSGNDPIYTQKAYSLGRLLAEKSITLVYGGGNVGLMKAVADGCLEHNGTVIGVIPHMLKELELAHSGLHKLYTTQSMQERKMLMLQLSDAFIAMPGGFGTMEEMFEALTLTQLNYQSKPVGMLNINGYYDPLKQWISLAHEQGFLSSNHTQLLHFSAEGEDLLEKLGQASFFSLASELTKG